jgi:hypothetical protein
VVGSCKHGNESRGSIKVGKFAERLSPSHFCSMELVASRNDSLEGDTSQCDPKHITSLMHKNSHVLNALVNYPSRRTGNLT